MSLPAEYRTAMALEKLVLRGILWGADKVPDTWFDKLPGNYYKPSAVAAASKQKIAEINEEQDQDKEERRAKSRAGSRHRHSHRQSTDDDGPAGDRRHHSSRRSSHRRTRHSSADEGSQTDKDHDDSFRISRSRTHSRMPSGDKFSDADRRAPQPPYPATPETRSEDLNAPGAATSFAVPAAAAYTAPTARNGLYSPPLTASTAPKPATYVPYADVYGTRAPASPPDSVDDDRRAAHPVSSPPMVNGRPYHQNPYAQDGVPDAQPAYVPELERDDDSRYDASSRYDHEDENDERSRRSSRSPSPTSTYRSRSHSRSSRRRRDDNDKDKRSRTRSRPGSTIASSIKGMKDKDSRKEALTRAKTKFRQTFDPSDGGLGYGAIGALAGGLLGDEIGGIIPTALGAAVGALGGNAFHRREVRQREKRQSVQFDDYRWRYDDRRYDDGRSYDGRSASAYDDRRYDDRRYEDRSYDGRSYDDRSYDDRSYDDRYDDGYDDRSRSQHAESAHRSSRRPRMERGESRYYSD